MLLPEPLTPTRRSPLLVQVDPFPVTTAELLVAPVLKPTVEVAAVTFPPLVIIRLFPEPPLPTVRVAALLQADPAPVTTALLLALPALLPTEEEEARTLPPSETTMLLSEPASPMARLLPAFQVELDPGISSPNGP